ncbi:MAG: membrane protein insertase YidC [Cellvibrionales bacterium]|nr:membrane protein insertase YidC [Cellvibrionales bacterium]
MDKIRVTLISAIALVTFYGFIQFAEFKKEKDSQALVERHESASQFNESSVPQVEQNTSNDSDDVPSLVTKTAIQESPKSQATSLIQVKTDNFTLSIDKEGGDIVYLALNKQAAQLETPEIPFVLLQENNQHFYIAQSGIFGKDGIDTKEGRARFSSASNEYTLGDQDTLNVDLNFQQGAVSIIKRFTFTKDDYLINVDYLIDNKSQQPWEASFYAQIKRDSQRPVEETSGMGMSPYLGFATRTKEDRFKKISFSDLDEKKESFDIQGGWVAMIQHYFLSAWVFDESKNTQYSLFESKKDGLNIARGISSETIVEPGQTGVIKASFYAGPKDQYRLEKISEGLDLSVDYSFLWMIAQPLYALLYFINNGVLHLFGNSFDIFGGVGNWGFAIIILTLIVKLCFYSLNVKAYTSMAKMRAIQPKMLALKDRYGDDRQKLSQETMALYKKEGVNPIGGCLPMLVQMPIFIALYWVLMESVELRHAPFIGWIHDLSAMDPYFILPLIMGASMWVQQKMQPAPPDPMQAKIMQFLPVIFTFFFLFFPAGLVLYWVVNNLVTIAQQWYITRQLEKKSA